MEGNYLRAAALAGEPLSRLRYASGAGFDDTDAVGLQPSRQQAELDRQEQGDPVGVALGRQGQPMGEQADHRQGRYRRQQSIEPAARSSPAQQPHPAGQQQPRQWAQQEQVVVGPSEAVLGAPPQEEQQ